MFDELVKMYYIDNSSETSQVGGSLQEVNLRICETRRGEEQKCFTIDVYKRKEPLFIYRGIFSRLQFEDIRRKQHLKYNFENAIKEIVTSVRRAGVLCNESNEILQLVMEQDKCRLQLMQRTPHTDFVTLSLELMKLNGDPLNNHLLSIIQEYKQKADAYAATSERIAQLSAELQRVRQESSRQCANLQEECAKLEREFHKKEDECQNLIEHVATLEASERRLKAENDLQNDDLDKMYDDNVTLVSEIENLEATLRAMKDSLQQSEQRIVILNQSLAKSNAAVELAVKKHQDLDIKYNQLKRAYDKLQSSLAAKTKEIAEAEKLHQNELEDLNKKYNSLKTHASLLEKQVKDLQEKVSVKEKNEKLKNDSTKKRIFKK